MKQVVGIDGKSGITEKIPYLSYLFFRLVLYIVISVLPDALEIKTDKIFFLGCDVFERIKNGFHTVDIVAGIIYPDNHFNAGLQQQFYVAYYRVEAAVAILAEPCFVMVRLSAIECNLETTRILRKEFDNILSNERTVGCEIYMEPDA